MGEHAPMKHANLHLDISSHVLPTFQAEAMRQLNTVLGEGSQEAEQEEKHRSQNVQG